METTNTYLTTEQAIEESKKQDGLIPSEFLSTFPNNFGINLCAVKGFNIEMTEDKQYKSITIDFIPKIETIDERIKKEIIQFLQLPHPQFVGKRNHEEWIAWLEKPKYTEEDLDKAYKCADEVQYRRGYEDAKKEIEKQGEQKFNDIHPIFRVGDYIRNKKTGDKVLIEQLDIATKVYCYVSYDGAASNHSDFPFSKQDEWKLIGQKVVEQKPAWSEEDERLQQCLIRDQERGLDEVRNNKVGHLEIISDLKEMYRERIDWLESLKERIKGE